MNFMWLDIGLMIVFVIGISIFLITRKKNLRRQGWLYLYYTEWGVKLIARIGKKYRRALKITGHISVWLGYILMAGMLWLFARTIWIYLSSPNIVKAMKIPPITPLIPYLPQMFKLSFLPPFYFIYWVLIILIIAVSHEFFHGIYAAANKIKTNKTGFGFFPFFLPIFTAAFVEPDPKAMEKSSNFAQRTVLSAGTFANILTTIIGLFLIAGFFALSFTPSGIVFDDYAYEIVETSEITMLNNISLLNPTYESILVNYNNSGENKFKIGSQNYYGLRSIYEEGKYLGLYSDSPAINSKIPIRSNIVEVNSNPISSLEGFSEELSKYSVGQEIIITTIVEDQLTDHKIVLQENPEKEDSAWVGIVFSQNSKGIMTKIFMSANFYKDPHMFYKEKYQGAQFIYDFLWWLVLISFSVALINMLPMGIFDGGRFFYLTVLAITKREKIARKSFKYVTWFLLALVVLMMVYWAKAFF